MQRMQLSRVKTRKLAQKRDKSSSGIIILKVKLIQIGFIIADITLCNVTLTYLVHFKGQLMSDFCHKPQLHHFSERMVKIVIIANI